MDSNDFFQKLEHALVTMDLPSFRKLVPLLQQHGKSEYRVFTKLLSRPGELFDESHGVYYSDAAVNALKEKPEVLVIILQEGSGIRAADLPLSTGPGQN